MSQEERVTLKMVVGLVLILIGLFGLFSSSYGMGGMMGWMMGRWGLDGSYGGLYYLNLLPLGVSLVVTALGIFIILDAIREKR